MKVWPARVMFTIGLAAAAAGCATSEPEPLDLPVPSDRYEVSRRKQVMLRTTEKAIQRIVNQATEDIEKVRSGYESEYELLPTVLRLNVVDDVLEQYGEAQRASFSVAVTDLEERTCAALEQVLSESEARMWAVAESAGATERGADLGFRSGYQELDAKVNAAVVQLERRANVEGIQQFSIVRRTERTPLQRKVREEIEGLGVLQLFISAPVEIHRYTGHPQMRSKLVEARASTFPVYAETVAEVMTYSRGKDDPVTPLRFLQAVRRRVERGGLVVVETPWEWCMPGESGEYPLRPEIDHPDYLATEVTSPLPNAQVEGFTALRSHTLVEEYRTGLQRTDTGEVVATVGWQVVWAVDYRGQLRVLVERAVERLTDGSVLRALLTAQAASTEDPEEAPAEVAETEGPRGE